MSAYTTKTVLEQAREDIHNAFEAGRRESRNGTATKPAVVHTSPLDAILEAQTALAGLIIRMQQAMKAIAEEAGAYACESCGQYTLRSIEIESHSDEMGTETEICCPRCAPVNVPF